MNAGLIKLALLAGGRGTRLGDLTKNTPKSMVEVVGKPFIVHQLELLREKGITDIVLCVNYLGKQIEEFVGDGSRFDLNVEYSYDQSSLNPSGIGGAIRDALPILGDTFWVTYGDSYLDIDFSSILEYFLIHRLDPKYTGLMTIIKSNSPIRGDIVFKDNIITYNNYMFRHNSEYIDYGLSIFRREAFYNAKFFTIPFDLKKLLREASSYKILGYEIKKEFHEIGTVKGLKETEEYIKSRRRNTK